MVDFDWLEMVLTSEALQVLLVDGVHALDLSFSEQNEPFHAPKPLLSRFSTGANLHGWMLPDPNQIQDSVGPRRERSVYTAACASGPVALSARLGARACGL